MSAGFPVPRQLDVPVSLDGLPAGGTTDTDRPFPIPDGGPQLLVRDAGNDFQLQPFGREQHPPAGRIPRTGFRALPVSEGLADPYPPVSFA